MPRGTLRQAQGAPPSGRPGLLGPRRRWQGRRGHAAGSRAGSGSARGTAARPRGSGSAAGQRLGLRGSCSAAGQRLGSARRGADSGWAQLAAARTAAQRLLCRETGVEGAGGVPRRPGELPNANRAGAVPYEASGCTTERTPSSKSLRAADRRGHSPFSEAGDCYRDRQNH